MAKKFISVLLCVLLLRKTSILSVGDDMIVLIKSGNIKGFGTTAATGKQVSAWYGIPCAITIPLLYHC
jgi:hypothetical protein